MTAAEATGWGGGGLKYILLAKSLPLHFNFWIQETPKWVLLQTVKTQMKCSINFIAGSTLFLKIKKIFRQKNTIFFLKL